MGLAGKAASLSAQRLIITPGLKCSLARFFAFMKMMVRGMSQNVNAFQIQDQRIFHVNSLALKMR